MDLENLHTWRYKKSVITSESFFGNDLEILRKQELKKIYIWTC